MTVVVFRHIESDWVDNIDCVDGFCRKALLRQQQPPSTVILKLETKMKQFEHTLNFKYNVNSKTRANNK